MAPFHRAQKLILRAGLVIALASLAPNLQADDWPQWFGPKRDGVWRESGILRTFPEDGPVVRWRVPIGAGYSGPSVSGGKVFISDRQASTNRDRRGQRASENPGLDRVLCLDEETGDLIWQHSYAANYTVSYPSGPRATPAIDSQHVYTLGTEGKLFCLKESDGTVVWEKDLKADYNSKTQIWGHAASPLIHKEKVVVVPGGTNNTVVALDKRSGKELWRSLSTRDPGYCHPIIIEHGGKEQLIIWHPEAINSLNPETGEVYWTISWSIRAGLTIATPRLLGDRLFLSSFYNGSTMLKLGKNPPSANILWQSQKASERDTTELHSIISTPIFTEEHIYGVCSYGQLRCLSSTDGKRLWETFAATTTGKPVRWATAFITPHEDRYFLFNELGELLIANLGPEGFKEIDRTPLIDPTNSDARGRLVVWSHPAYANQHIIVRNDKEIIRVSLQE